MNGVIIQPIVDREPMRRREFEQRYAATPEQVKAHLLDGIVYVDDYAGRASHGSASATIGGVVLSRFATSSEVFAAGVNCSLRIDDQNEPQPDHVLFIDEAYGGQAYIDEDDFLAGVPELIAEIAKDKSSIDLYLKKEIYRRAGMREYLVWRVRDAAIDWFERHGSEFVAKQPDAAGVLKSIVFPGLWLDAAALLRGDLAAVIATLNAGLATPEHAAFVANLAARVPQG